MVIEFGPEYEEETKHVTDRSGLRKTITVFFERRFGGPTGDDAANQGEQTIGIDGFAVRYRVRDGVLRVLGARKA